MCEMPATTLTALRDRIGHPDGHIQTHDGALTSLTTVGDASNGKIRLMILLAPADIPELRERRPAANDPLIEPVSNGRYQPSPRDLQLAYELGGYGGI
jgi:hypothetical protein